MASTNKTTNYELSQYVGTDKPTYLGDYNSDMSKIDTAIHNNATSISGVSGDVSLLQTAVSNVELQAQNNSTNIGTLSNLKTTNKTNLVNATNEIVDKFNFTNIKSYTTYDSVKSGTVPNNYSLNLTVATNSDGSIAKIYGGVTASSFVGGNFTCVIETDLRPSSDITIQGKLRTIYTSASNNSMVVTPYLSSFTIRSNGNLEIASSYSSSGTNKTVDIYLPCVYFLSDFGDAPIS